MKIAIVRMSPIERVIFEQELACELAKKGKYREANRVLDHVINDLTPDPELFPIRKRLKQENNRGT